jgi:hypothetical protein
VRQVNNFRYTDYHVFAVEEFQDENGDWQIAACGIFGLWLILTKVREASFGELKA